MKRSLLATLTLLIYFTQANAQIDTSYIVDDIVISENRQSYPINSYARQVEVIQKTEIVQMPVASVSDLLQYVSGVDIRRRGVNDIQTDIGIRGGTFNQVLILINGIKMIDPQTGHHNFNLSLDINDIERIEVIKGPSARIYGQNAFTGSINIITKINDAEEAEIDIQSSLGSYTTFSNGMTLTVPNKIYNQQINLNYQTSDGYKYNTDYKLGNLFYQSTLTLPDQPINFYAGYSDRSFGANGFYASERFKDQYEEITTAFVAVQTDINAGSFQLKPKFYIRNNKDRYLFVRNNPSLYENNHKSYNYTGELHGKYISSFGVTGIGIDYSHQTLSSNNLGERKRSIFGTFIDQRMTFFNDKLDITAGAYVEKISDNDVKVYPGIDLSYGISNHLHWFASYNHASRVPTYTNLYYSSPSEQGNENLLAERISAIEMGLKYSRGFLASTLSIFTHEMTNLIDWAKPNEADDQWQALNFNRVNSTGIDFNNRLDISSMAGMSRGLSLDLNYHFINAEVDDNSEIAVSRYALESLKHQFIAKANVELLEDLFISPTFRYLDRVSLDDYQLLDVNLSFIKEHYDLFFNLYNATDQKYRETNLVEMPGRNFEIGIRLK